MIKGRIIGSLGSILSFPQNLVHVQYNFLNFDMIILKISITKWGSYYKMRQKTVSFYKNVFTNVTEVYCKVCRVLQSVKHCYYKVRQKV